MPNKTSWLRARIRHFLRRQIGYLDLQLLQNTQDGQWLPATEKAQPRILVLSRHCYQERVQWLPVQSSSAAFKLIRAQRKVEGSRLYWLGPSSNGKTPVIWFSPKVVLPSSAWLVLPETVLMASAFSKGTVVSYQSPLHSETIYLTNSVAGPVSSTRGALLNSPAQFMLSQGELMEQATELDALEHSKLLQQALKGLYRLPLRGFFQLVPHQSGEHFRRVQSFLWPAVAAITLYLLLVVQWTDIRLHQTERDLELVTIEAAAVLSTRDKVQQQIQQYQQLLQVLPNESSLLAIWQVLLPLYQKNVLITAINQQQQQVSISIEAASATQALQLLLQQPAVANAELEGNVRRQGELEQATVRFELKGVL